MKKLKLVPLRMYNKSVVDKETDEPILDENGKQLKKTIYVYTVNGSAESVSAYIAQSDRIIVDEETGKPLYFTDSFVVATVPSLVYAEGLKQFIVDQTELQLMKTVVDKKPQFADKMLDRELALIELAMENFASVNEKNSAKSEADNALSQLEAITAEDDEEESFE